MDTLDFLRRVLPSEGMYCKFTLTGKRNRFFGDLAELVSSVLTTDQQGQDTYFAISTFVDDSSRRSQNVQATKVIPIDVDCGEDKPFPTWKEGLKALGGFVTSLKLPKPLIIRSGNGLHTYWVLERDLSRDEWIPLARAMRDAAVGYGFDIDTTKTADPSLVLRPVGTHNYKDPTKPKPVELLLDGGATTVADLRKALAYYYNGSVTPVKPKNSGLLDKLAVQSDLPPAVGSLIAEKCAQVKWATENQDKVSEPLWYALLGVAAFCEDPEGTAARWSDQHPGYSETATHKKLQHWREQTTGATTCAKFESERPVGCKGCPFAGKIGSPIRLGVRYKEIDTSGEAPADVQTEIPVPKPFKRTAAGIMATIDDADIAVAPFDIYPLGYGYDEHLGYEIVQFMWNRPHVGWSVLTIRQAFMADGTYREFVGCIADQGIVLDSKRQTEYFQIMLRSYINELRKVRTVTNHYATMGWKEDNTVFVVGDDLYRRKPAGGVEKDTIRLATHVSRAGSDMFTVKGDYDLWKAGTALLGRAKLFPHQFSIGLGLASILMQFTGLKGVTVSFYGPSGSGKTLAQLMQQSVWGDPEKLHFQSKFTSNALFSRFGLYSHLPMTIDEATQMTDRDIGDYLYWVSQGRDKARLTRGADEKAPREWALFSTLSTNKSVSSKLLVGGDESDAQLARLLELRIDPSPLFYSGTDAGRKLHRLFTQNYGHAGRDFVVRLMTLGEQVVRAMLADAFETFAKKYGAKFSGTERYWEMTYILVDLALQLASDWKIIGFDYKATTRWALSQIDVMRDTVVDNYRDAFDLLAQYVNEHLSDTLLIYHDPNKAPEPNYARLPKGPIRIRIDGHRVKGSDKLVGGTMMLERSSFREWFAKHGGNIRELTKEIAESGADATPATKKASLGKHTPLSPPQCYVIGVDLKHPRLRSILEGAAAQQLDVSTSDVINLTARRPGSVPK